jgi:fumarate hydratase class II
LIPALSELQRLLEEKAHAFDKIVKIGRTHLQDAVPIRLGQEFSGYAAQVEHSVRRLGPACESLSELPIGGTALGTGINTHAEFPPRMTALLSQDTGLSFQPAANSFEAMANRDAAVEASGVLRTVAVSLSNIANNIRWLASGPRCGIGEIRIPELQPGSSIMPGKVNPVIPEAVMMVAAQVAGNDATITWANALGSNFDLNVMMPVIAYNLLQSIDLLAKAAQHLAEKCVAGIEADEERCALLIERSLAMCTALAPRIGYDNAAAIAKRAYATRRNVREVALEIAGSTPEQAAELLAEWSSAPVGFPHGVPTAHEVEELLDPFGQTVRGTGVGGSAGG